MSRALDYLLRERPRAMGAYFEFLRDAGSRLDPRTRALISVITKVSTQTEKGLVQYTRKALAAGVSSEEILDALLAAFPALGLSRIVWAVDVLMDHGVAGFGEVPADADEAAAAELLDVAALDELPQGRAVKRGGPGRAVLLYREGDEVRAFKGYCTHHGMELMERGIDGNMVTCFQHGWQFSLPEGSCPRGAQWALEDLPVSIENGRVRVTWQVR